MYIVFLFESKVCELSRSVSGFFLFEPKVFRIIKGTSVFYVSPRFVDGPRSISIH